MSKNRIIKEYLNGPPSGPQEIPKGLGLGVARRAPRDIGMGRETDPMKYPNGAAKWTRKIPGQDQGHLVTNREK